MAIFYVDYAGGSDSNTGASFALRRKTLSLIGSATPTPVAGDTVRIMKSADSTDMGQTATWTKSSRTVALTTAVTANITLCETAWTASANVTCAAGAGSGATSRKEGTNQVSHDIAAGFTTGLVAFFDTGTLDLSTYQQVSFWIQVSAATAANVFRLRLSTTTGGTTATHEFVIDRALNTGRWTPLTFNLGANMNAAILSVALVADSDPGAVIVYMDNILACKATSSVDSLSLQSLIGQNANNDQVTWALKSINGTTLTVDVDSNSAAGVGRGWWGTSTGSQQIWKRETTKTDRVTTASTVVQSPNAVSGTAASRLIYSGGWNTTDMSTQTGDTIFDGLDGFGYGLTDSSSVRNFTTWENVGVVRYDIGFYMTGTSTTITRLLCAGHCGNYGIRLSGNGSTLTSILGVNSNNTSSVLAGCWLGTAISVRNIIGTIYANSNAGSGIYFDSACASMQATPAGGVNGNNNGVSGLRINCIAPIVLRNVSASDNATNGVKLGDQTNFNGHRFYGLTTGGNGTGIEFATPGVVLAGSLYVYNWTSTSDTAKMSTFNAGGESRIYSHNDGGVEGVHKVYSDTAPADKIIIASNNTTTFTGSGLSWCLFPTASRDAFYPTKMLVGSIAFNANALVTAKAQIRRSSTSATTTVRIPGGQVAGVGADVTANGSAAIDTWEQVTLTFTPTVSGAVEMHYEAYGAVASCFIDSLDITQA